MAKKPPLSSSSREGETFQDDLQRSLAAESYTQEPSLSSRKTSQHNDDNDASIEKDSESRSTQKPKAALEGSKKDEMHSSSVDVQERVNESAGDSVDDEVDGKRANQEGILENNTAGLLLRLEKKISPKMSDESSVGQLVEKKEGMDELFGDEKVALKSKNRMELSKGNTDILAAMVAEESESNGVRGKQVHKEALLTSTVASSGKPTKDVREAFSATTDKKGEAGKSDSFRGETIASVAGSPARLEGGAATTAPVPVVKTGMPQALLEQVVSDSHLRLAVQKSSALISLPMADGSDVALKLSIKAGVVDVKMAGDASEIFLQKSGELRSVLQSEGLDLRSLTKVSELAEIQEADVNDSLDGDDDGREAYQQEKGADRQAVDEFAISDDGTLLANTTHDNEVEHIGLHDEEKSPANANLLTSSPDKRRVHIRV
ncbi:MAG: hypothetical protein GY822_15455 [Deltaproteobacteria bacterium]|nr:hypothetical protein [Deltaproteobacteria bacterium]